MMKPLDLSNLLRHAFISGFQAKGGTITEAIGFWPDYDPEQCPAYARVVEVALSPSPAPVVVEAGAQKIASWLGFAWDGLYEGSVVAKGFPIFTHGQFGWHFQGYKDDLRNLARDILALASLSQPAKGAVVGLDEWEGQITDGAELASAERNRAARIASASPAKGEREGGE